MLEETPIPGETIKLMQLMEAIPLHSGQIPEWTRRDPVLSKVHRYALGTWSITCPSKELQPYFNRRTEISMEDGCLLWGHTPKAYMFIRQMSTWVTIIRHV